MLGIVLDPNNLAGRPPVRALRPFSWARLTAIPGLIVARYAGQLHRAGIDTALVLARESFGTARREDWPSMVRSYVRICRPTALVIGNEPDAYLLPEPSPSSWTMDIQEYTGLMWAVADALRDGLRPRPLLIGAGLVSGQPGWLEDMPSWITDDIDGWDIHPYGKGPEEADEMLDRYSEALHGLPLYVLEWNRPEGEIPAYLDMLERHNVPAACFFCWSDGMVPGMGITRAQLRALKGLPPVDRAEAVGGWESSPSDKTT